MPRAKCFKKRASAAWGWLLTACACLVASAVQAQAPSLLDVVESAKQTKLLEQSKALIDAYKATPANPPAAAARPPAGAQVPTPAAPVAAAPVLRAIYGVNHLLEAEVVLDGQSYSLYSDDARADIGPWTYGVVFREGVLLVRKPLNAKQSGVLDGLSDQGLERLISCKKLGLPQTQCLFLPASKASTGSISPTRAASTSMGALPPLPLPR